MNPLQQAAFAAEVDKARALVASGDLSAAFTHLERAHVLGQYQVRPHVLSHWLMLRVALRQKDFAAAWGQLVRMVLGALGSAVNVVPTGNTGGSNVNMFKRMPIAPELDDLIAGRTPGQSSRPPRD